MKQEILKRINIENDENDIFIECPHCQMTEQQPIDQQRHHLQSFGIDKWRLKRSVTQCNNCGNIFVLVWDYKVK